MDSNTKRIILSLIGVFILFLSVVGMSYALWQRQFIGVKENSITTGHISFSYTEDESNVISITNAVPISDEQGKIQTDSNTMFDFIVSTDYSSNDNLKYEIFTVNGSNNTLDEKYFKVYLTDQNDNPVEGYREEVPRYSELEQTADLSGRYLLKTRFINKKDFCKYRLRTWISSDYNDTLNVNTISFKVNVRASV